MEVMKCIIILYCLCAVGCWSQFGIPWSATEHTAVFEQPSGTAQGCDDLNTVSGMSAGSLVSTPLLPHPPPPSSSSRRTTTGCVTRGGGKSNTGRPQPLESQPPLSVGIFSGHPTPWKTGDPVAHPTLLTRGAKTAAEKPFRSFSERADHLIRQHSAPLRRDRGPCHGGSRSHWAAVFLPATAA